MHNRVRYEERKRVKIPDKKHDTAKLVLHHAGYAENNTKVKALIHAFDKMEQDPELVEATESDSIVEAGKSSKKPSAKFNQIKHSWHSYHTTSEQANAVQEEDSQSQDKIEQMRQHAQELADTALDMLMEQQNSAVINQRRQKYIFGAIGLATTVLGVVLSSYWSSRCPESQG